MDLVTFGEGLVRLSPPDQQPLVRAPRFDAHVGGAELNVAVGVSRLQGRMAARWISRLPDNALGRFIEGTATVNGVDARVEWTSDERVGLYFLQKGSSPRQATVVYDRAGSSFSKIVPGTIDWPAQFAGARWFHVSGITPALSDSAATVTLSALRAARDAGLKVSYDVNYRMKLWGAARARTVQEPLLKYVDVLIVSEADARTVFDAAGTTAEGIARELAARFAIDVVAVTTRDAPDGRGAVVVASGVAHAAPRHEVDVVERVGTGDAFTAGLIASRLEDRGWDDAVRFATAAAALKLTMPGDFFVGDRTDVERLLERTHARAPR
jgi:2-dehydro-3-deoxygluconokinase